MLFLALKCSNQNMKTDICPSLLMWNTLFYIMTECLLFFFFLSLIIVRTLSILCITFYKSLWINFKKILIHYSFMLISKKKNVFFPNTIQCNTIFKLFDDNVESWDIAITHVRPSSSVSFPHLNSLLTKHSTKLNQILGWSSSFWGLFFFLPVLEIQYRCYMANYAFWYTENSNI